MEIADPDAPTLARDPPAPSPSPHSSMPTLPSRPRACKAAAMKAIERERERERGGRAMAELTATPHCPKEEEMHRPRRWRTAMRHRNPDT